MQTTVLIIGGGPAGSIAATALAQRGVDVFVVDKHSFPRDKTCGDALLPDALAALRAAAVDGAVLPRAKRLGGLRIYAPNGTHVDLSGESAVLPRVVLDDILLQGATAAGARFLSPYTLVEPLYNGTTVNGAVFRHGRTDETLKVRAAVTLLATGAASIPLRLFDVATREPPSATAARVYITVDPAVASEFDYLCISYDKRICPGYGWIFPGPDAVFNVGVGYFYDSKVQPPTRNLRHLLDTFLHTFPPAMALVRHSTAMTPVKGAPLRTALTGSRLSRPGLLVIGEAAGLTYSFSGEGIGKAMDSGLRAAACTAAELAVPAPDLERLASRYAVEISSAFGDNFRAYKTVQDWLEKPWIANLLAWRANSGQYARRQLEAFINESARPDTLFSVSGFLRALLT